MFVAGALLLAVAAATIAIAVSTAAALRAVFGAFLGAVLRSTQQRPAAPSDRWEPDYSARSH
jgi:hypothetical protein